MLGLSIKNGIGINLNSALGATSVWLKRERCYNPPVGFFTATFRFLLFFPVSVIVGETQTQEAAKLTNYVLIKENSDKYLNCAYGR